MRKRRIYFESSTPIKFIGYQWGEGTWNPLFSLDLVASLCTALDFKNEKVERGPKLRLSLVLCVESRVRLDCLTPALCPSDEGSLDFNAKSHWLWLSVARSGVALPSIWKIKNLRPLPKRTSHWIDWSKSIPTCRLPGPTYLAHFAWQIFAPGANSSGVSQLTSFLLESSILDATTTFTSAQAESLRVISSKVFFIKTSI